MSSVVGRKVSSLRVHTTTHATGIGNIGPNISKATDPTGVKGRLQMEVVAEGVLLTAGKTQVLIPPGNIISYELEPFVEEPKGAAAGGGSGGASSYGQQIGLSGITTQNTGHGSVKG